MAKKMRIILTSDVKGLGVAGQTVDVARGYAMNFLLVYGHAMIDSTTNRLRINTVVKAHEKRVAGEVAEIEQLLQQINQKSIQIQASVHGEDELYGSVGVSDIVSALQSQLQVQLDRHVIQLSDPIRVLGQYEIPLSFAHGRSGIIHLTVSKAETGKKKAVTA